MFDVKIHMEYNKSNADVNLPAAAELDITYRRLDGEQLLEVEEAYVTDSITSLIAIGRSQLPTNNG